jgi:hypothetical protein
MCRLAYLVTPKPELLRTLKIEPGTSNEVCRPNVVITPIRDYEEAFEGWKRAWKSKAKHQFVTDFIELWPEEFPQFTAQLRDAPAEECFDKWWNITEADIFEIDAAWNPKNCLDV